MSGQDTVFWEWSDKCYIARALTVAVLDTMYLLAVPQYELDNNP